MFQKALNASRQLAKPDNTCAFINMLAKCLNEVLNMHVSCACCRIELFEDLIFTQIIMQYLEFDIPSFNLEMRHQNLLSLSMLKYEPSTRSREIMTIT